jgi:CheY-like chemotaxis protein
MAERVLIVDDDPVQRRLLQNMVEKAGYQVATADSGEAAVGLIMAPDGPHFECIVLDLVMPDLDGLGVLGRMREAGIAIPVIVRPPMAASTSWCRQCAPGRSISS